MSEETEQERLERHKRKEMEYLNQIGDLEKKLGIVRAFRTLHKHLSWGPDGGLNNWEDYEILDLLEKEADAALEVIEWGGGQALLYACWHCGRSVALGSGAYFDRHQLILEGDVEKKHHSFPGSFLCAPCWHKKDGEQIQEELNQQLGEANKLLPKTEPEDFTRENGGGDSVATQKCAAKECCPTLSHKTPVIIGGVDYTRI